MFKNSINSIFIKYHISFPFLFLCFLLFSYINTYMPNTLPVKYFLNSNEIEENAHLYFLSTRDGYLHALNNTKKEIWKVYLDTELMTSFFTDYAFNQNIAVFPFNEGIMDYNISKQNYQSYIKDLVKKQYVTYKDYQFLGKTKSTIYIIDTENGEILQKIDEDINFINMNKKVYIRQKNRRKKIITVVRVDYILNCFKSEDNQRFWNATYSDVIIKKGNEAFDNNDFINDFSFLQKLVSEYKQENGFEHHEINYDNVISAYVYFDNEIIPNYKIYDRSTQLEDLVEKKRKESEKYQITDESNISINKNDYIIPRLPFEKKEENNEKNLLLRYMTFNRILIVLIILLCIFFVSIIKKQDKKIQELKENKDGNSIIKNDEKNNNNEIIDENKNENNAKSDNNEKEIKNVMEENKNNVEDNQKENEEKKDNEEIENTISLKKEKNNINDNNDNKKDKETTKFKNNIWDSDDDDEDEPEKSKTKKNINSKNSKRITKDKTKDKNSKNIEKDEKKVVNGGGIWDSVDEDEEEEEYTEKSKTKNNKTLSSKNNITKRKISKIKTKIKEVNNEEEENEEEEEDDEEEINTKKNIKNKKSKKQENKKQEISIQSNNIIRENSGSIIFGSEKENIKIKKKLTRLDTDFENLEKIGEGGYGLVLKGTHKIDKFIYAIKIINISNFKNKTEIEEVLNEANRMSMIKDKYIVNYNICWYEDNLGSAEKFYNKKEDESISQNSLLSLKAKDIDKSNNNSTKLRQKESKMNILQSLYCANFRDDSKLLNTSIFSMKYKKKYFFILMEYCDGNTLEDLITKHNKDAIPIDRHLIYNYTRQILKGLKVLHRNGIIHSDIKPGNIFLKKVGENEQVKIGDFGMATLKRGCAKLQSKDIIGFTPLYSAPEQKNKNGTYNEKVDIYACGLILYELIGCFGTNAEKYRAFDDLKNNGIIFEEIEKKYKEESELIKMMTTKDYDDRPSAEEILGNNIFKELGKIVNKE